jgi:hypothetical protein
MWLPVSERLSPLLQVVQPNQSGLASAHAFPSLQILEHSPLPVRGKC